MDLREIKKIETKEEDYKKFAEALNYVNTWLAKHIAADGEGASALFEVKVIGAKSKEQAVTLSKSIITSNLTRQQFSVMMQTGDESYVQWAIPVQYLT